MTTLTLPAARPTFLFSPEHHAAALNFSGSAANAGVASALQKKLSRLPSTPVKRAPVVKRATMVLSTLWGGPVHDVISPQYNVRAFFNRQRGAEAGALDSAGMDRTNLSYYPTYAFAEGCRNIVERLARGAVGPTEAARELSALVYVASWNRDDKDVPQKLLTSDARQFLAMSALLASFQLAVKSKGEIDYARGRKFHGNPEWVMHGDVFGSVELELLAMAWKLNQSLPSGTPLRLRPDKVQMAVDELVNRMPSLEEYKNQLLLNAVNEGPKKGKRVP